MKVKQQKKKQKKAIIWNKVLIVAVIASIVALAIILSLVRQTQNLTEHAATNTFSMIGGCQMFPSNNVWNFDISNLPVDSNSANYIASIGQTSPLLNGFGDTWGMPYNVVPGTQPSVPVTFTYASESNP